MKRTAFLTMLIAAILMPAARARGEGACSNTTAAGKWGFTDSGTVVGVGPRAAVGIFTLDATGNLLNGKATSSLNGTIADETFSGTYTVNADCTGTLTAVILDQSGNKILTAKANLAWDDNMRQLRGIFTSAVLPNGTPLATLITVDARRLLPQSSDSQ